MAISAFPESLHLVETAHLGRSEYGAMCFGDTDHDGKDEVACSDFVAGAWRLHVFESQGGSVYSDEYVGAGVLPFALCDLDRDGKGEVVGQQGYRVMVYESVDAHSYPAQLVWASKDLSNVVGEATVGDTDLDGKMEIIHSASTFGSLGYLYIFENVGDNYFAQVCSLQVTTGAMGNKAIGDLDSDGIPEIAFGTIQGGVYVVKSAGDNEWRIQWMTTTDLVGAYGACIGQDLDGDRKPELYIAGSGVEGWTTLVLESSGVDQYSVVGTLTQSDGWAGNGSNAVGNFTGSGRLEYAMRGLVATWIFAATAPDHWELISTLTAPDDRRYGVSAVDLNHNGRHELFWSSEASPCTVYEHRDLVAEVSFPSVYPSILGVAPNPVRWEAFLQLPVGLPAGSYLQVYDVSGRLVQGIALVPRAVQAHFRTDRIAAGTYFVQIESSKGTPCARGRVSVVH